MGTVDIVFKFLILGLLAWSLRGFLLERTKKRKAGEEYLTASELDIKCKEQRAGIIKETEREMSHVRDMIEKDLERGQERFATVDGRLENIEEKQQKNHDTLLKISLSLAQLAKNAASSH